MHRWDATSRLPPPGTPPIRYAEALAVDGTPGKLRGRRWRRPYRGWYVPASAPVAGPSQRIVEAAALLPTYGAVGGWAAGHWQGAGLLDGLSPDARSQLPVLLCLSERGQIRPRQGVRISRERLPPREVVECRGVACTTPLRTGFDCARLATDLTEAVVMIDVLAQAGVLTLDALADYVHEHPGWRDVAQARAALALADCRSRSPAETRLRMLWTLRAALPRPEVNAKILDSAGRLLGIADLLDYEAGVVVEYDGADHRGLERHTADNAREESFECHGLVVVRVTALDLYRWPQRTGQRLRAARERGLRRDRGTDQWLIG